MSAGAFVIIGLMGWIHPRLGFWLMLILGIAFLIHGEN